MSFTSLPEGSKEEALDQIFDALRHLTATLNRYDERSGVKKEEVFFTAYSGKALGEALAGVVKSILDTQWRSVASNKDAIKDARTDATFQRFMHSQCIETDVFVAQSDGKNIGGRA